MAEHGRSFAAASDAVDRASRSDDVTGPSVPCGTGTCALRERLQSLAEELVRTEERERRQLAQTVHDSIGQMLSLVSLHLQQWQRSRCPDDQTITHIRRMLDDILRDARTLTTELCPPFVSGLTLDDAIAWVSEWTGEGRGLPVHMEIRARGVRVKPELQALLVAAVRELLINSMKHAGASTIRVLLEPLAPGLMISVADDGIGIRASRAEGPDRRPGFGLMNMRRRLADFRVTMRVLPESPGGTRVILTIPHGAWRQDASARSTGQTSGSVPEISYPLASACS